MHNAFCFKNGRQRYKFMVRGHELTVFVKLETKCKNCCTEDEINGRLELLIDNIEFGGYIVQQNIGIRMGTTCALLISDLFDTRMKLSLYKNVSRTNK